MVVMIFLICRAKPVQRSRITRRQGVQWYANVKEQKNQATVCTIMTSNQCVTEERPNKTGISYGYVQNNATMEKQLTPAPLQCGLSYLPCSATVLVKSQNATTPQPPFSPDVTHVTFGFSQESRLGSKATVSCL
jgi:DNA-binding NtrC family response regulator